MGLLRTYRKKRNFSSTREPSGSVAKRKGDSFVIQKHAARRLHYDLRLEYEGVLKSWAVTRGPSLDPAEKRLAVEVEDHPIEYGDFEGTIPEGEYGGGSVIVWDRGSWKPIGDAAEGFRKGHLEFELKGEKLKGAWHLIRMRKRKGESRTNWLLIKAHDATARDTSDGDILQEQPQSVKSGVDVSEIGKKSRKTWTSNKRKPMKTKPAGPKEDEDGGVEPSKGNGDIDPSTLKKAKKSKLPDFVAPELATLVSAPPSGQRWVHEIKFDGYRLLARLQAGRVKLLTRSGLDWTKRFGKELAAEFSTLPAANALIDGELVVENEATGASDFSALQADLSEGRGDRFKFYAFDLIYLDGYDLCEVPLIDRKALLERVLAGHEGRIHFGNHFTERGNLILQHACRLSLEGLVSKLSDSPYRSGRNKVWVKSKCASRQEFVIGGYVPSSVSRHAIGALVLGLYNDKGLEHVGRVGTGFSRTVAEQLLRKLEKLRVPKTPFASPLDSTQARQVRYVRPELVAEVEFRSWTADQNLRHASFRGLREDKPAQDVVKEAPANGEDPTVTKRQPAPAVKLTHPDRLYWPDEGVTKEGLANYYSEVWSWIAPHIVARPLALLRCPDGITGQQFFQKHLWNGANKNILSVKDPKHPSEPLVSIENLDGLIGLVQAAALEIHPWGSTTADLEKPDLITMDLDPGEGTGWPQVIKAAKDIRERLTDAGLTPFIKTSGGKGLHVVCPLKPKANWDAVKRFCKLIADRMAADDPDVYVSVMTKSKRPGKIFIDYLRNERGMTAVAAYSTRARPGAMVSMPIEWEELDTGIGPKSFTIDNTMARLQSLKRNPWADFRSAAVPLPARI